MACPQAGLLRQFVALEWPIREPDILGILLGGSVVYRHIWNGDLSGASDWDGAIFMATKLDIFELVNNNRQRLVNMFAIAQEECPTFYVPSPSSEAWPDFDAVRFVGYTPFGLRKSIKILSMEYFSGSRTSLNILSFKDRRVFERLSSDGSRSYRVHQATRLEDGLHILHDQWVFRADPSYCAHGHELAHAAFGISTDLLMTGTWLHGGDTIERMVLNRLLQNYSALSQKHAMPDCFARSDQFDVGYRQWLAGRLETLNRLIPLRCHCACESGDSRFLYGLDLQLGSSVDSHPTRSGK